VRLGVEVGMTYVRVEVSVRVIVGVFVLVRVGKTAVGCGSVGLGVEEAANEGSGMDAVSVGVLVSRPLTPRSTNRTIPPSR